MAALAKTLGMSRETVGRAFKDACGISLARYCIHVRVMNAIMRP
jgi:transcriptional regulator GlxA family with amidase domain